MDNIILFPAPIILFFVLLRIVFRSKVKSSIETESSASSFSMAMFWFFLSAIVSPGIPAYKYFFTSDYQLGGSIELIFILPFAWLFCIFGIICLVSSVVKKIPTDNNP